MVSSDNFTIMEPLNRCAIKEDSPEFTTTKILEFALYMVGPFGTCANSKGNVPDIGVRFRIVMMSYFGSGYFNTPTSGMTELRSAMENKLEECLDKSELRDAKHFLINYVLPIFSNAISSADMFYNVLLVYYMYKECPKRAAGETDNTVFTRNAEMVRGLKFKINRPTYHTLESWRLEVKRIIPLLPGLSTLSIQKLQIHSIINTT